MTELEVSLLVLWRTGDQFSPLPYRLRRHPLARRRRRRRRGRHRHRRRGRDAQRRSAGQQRVRVGYVACLVPRVRVPSFRILLALARGHRRVLAHLRARRVDIRSRDPKHSLDVGGLGPVTGAREHVAVSDIQSSVSRAITLVRSAIIERELDRANSFGRHTDEKKKIQSNRQNLSGRGNKYYVRWIISRQQNVDTSYIYVVPA